MVVKGQGRYFDPTFNGSEGTWKREGYSTDVYTQYAVDFVHRNHDHPWFMWLCYGAPHVPSVPPERYSNLYADAALELESLGWKEHVAEVRLIVAGDYQRKGLGLSMARELYSIATEAGVEEIIVKMMRPQVAARSIFRKLGFHEETLLPDWVKDATGHKQDLILMRCDLKALWNKLEDFIAGRDFQRSR